MKKHMRLAKSNFFVEISQKTKLKKSTIQTNQHHPTINLSDLAKPQTDSRLLSPIKEEIDFRSFLMKNPDIRTDARENGVTVHRQRWKRKKKGVSEKQDGRRGVLVARVEGLGRGASGVSMEEIIARVEGLGGSCGWVLVEEIITENGEHRRQTRWRRSRLLSQLERNIWRKTVKWAGFSKCCLPGMRHSTCQYSIGPHKVG